MCRFVTVTAKFFRLHGIERRFFHFTPSSPSPWNGLTCARHANFSRCLGLNGKFDGGGGHGRFREEGDETDRDIDMVIRAEWDRR